MRSTQVPIAKYYKTIPLIKTASFCFVTRLTTDMSILEEDSPIEVLGIYKSETDELIGSASR